MIIIDEIEITSNNRNRSRYKSLGYEVPENGEKFKIKIKDANVGCRGLVELICDYCCKPFAKK